MANAKKCDRCGVYLDKKIIPRMKAVIDPEASSDYDIDVDLCYECYSDLEKFMSYCKKGEKASNDHSVCTNRCKFKEVFGEEWLKGLDNVIKNTTSRGIANALSSFLTEEYKGGEKE